ncbi:MAG: hypothetical protein KAS64_08630, partial [Spirochaetes bacterium]|nr:hypothetical protein [Spirochaetota bacterium]
MRIIKSLKKLFNSNKDIKQDINSGTIDIQYLKNRIVRFILLIFVLVGFFVLLYVIPVFLGVDGYIFIIIFLLFHIWICFLFFDKKLSFKTKTISIIFVIYFVGVSILFKFGPSVGVFFWLFAFSVLSAILLNVKA